MRWLVVALFALTYVGISARRVHLVPVGRPAMALIGASALVVAGAFAGPYGLSGDEALRAVEPHTLALLFGMMLVAAGLWGGGFFDRAADLLAARLRSKAALLWAVTVGAGLLSAVLVNDAVCLLATPLVLRVARRLRAAETPLLFAVAMGSNAGSALTLSGNPQNMIVARLSGLSYGAYLARAALPGLAALGLTAAVLHALHRHQLDATVDAHEGPVRASEAPETPNDPWLLRVALLGLVGTVVANLAGASLAWSALVAASVVLLAARERAHGLIARVDWSVLLFFAGLFVVVAALNKTGLPRELLGSLGAPRGARGDVVLVSVLALGSQVVSNVPLILVLEPWIRTFPDAAHAWTTTALVSTLAGNLTLLGSVANVIVLEQAGSPIGFRAYLRVGVPVTAASMGAALALAQLTR